ncbi:ATPase [Alteribacillus sp. HJP-4]|uniref:ATPase n=1 Tax=Alteribacillus sp. HJP-4 TaxID=2775394 RepID=UPI0035CD25F5
MRDISVTAINENESLIMAADFAAGIGMLRKDQVEADVRILASYTARTAFMELITAGGAPKSAAIHNGCGAGAWEEIIDEIRKTAVESRSGYIDISGSSETNMKLIQSSLGVTAAGVVNNKNLRLKRTPPHAEFAAIGIPLVGEEVLKNEEQAVTWPQVLDLLNIEGIYEVVPCGSRGIIHELGLLQETNGIYQALKPTAQIDLNKSCGPSTSVLISYHPDWEKKLADDFDSKFHKIIYQ